MTNGNEKKQRHASKRKAFALCLAASVVLMGGLLTGVNNAAKNLAVDAAANHTVSFLTQFNLRIQSESSSLTSAIHTVLDDAEIGGTHENSDDEEMKKTLEHIFRRLQRNGWISQISLVSPDFQNKATLTYTDDELKFENESASLDSASINQSTGIEINSEDGLILTAGVPWFHQRDLVGFISVKKKLPNVFKDIRTVLGHQMLVVKNADGADPEILVPGMKVSSQHVPNLIEQARRRELARIDAGGSRKLYAVNIVDLQGANEEVAAAVLLLFDITEYSDMFHNVLVSAVLSCLVAFVLFYLAIFKLTRHDAMPELHAEPFNIEAYADSERKELKSNLDRMVAAVEDVNDAIIMTNSDMKVTYLNIAAAHLFACTQESINEQGISELYIDPEEAKRNLAEILDGTSWDAEVDMRARENKTIIARNHCTPIMTDDYEVMGIMFVISDITAQKEAENALKKAATHDTLTGLFNRGYFMKRMEAAVRSAKRYEYPLSMCIGDVDKFKIVNDSYGHQAGDKVLVELAAILTSQLRSDDFAGRYGGDEFCIVFPHTSTEDAVKTVERFRKALSEKTFCAGNGGEFTVSSTFGVAELSEGIGSEKELFARADEALYEAKELGRNRVHIKSD